jgi:N-methylhydantoinase A/oxoprolinase/acetone carboxylase beta subunit
LNEKQRRTRSRSAGYFCLQPAQARIAVQARSLFFGGWREVDFHALDDIRPGAKLAGPAIIEAETTTVVLQ